MISEPQSQKSFRTERMDLSKILDKYGISYYADETWLWAGYKEEIEGAELYLSVVVTHLEYMLDVVASELKELNLPFRVVVDQFAAFRINNAVYGYPEMGKVMQIQIQRQEDVIGIASRLEPLTNKLRGGRILACEKIGTVMYYGYKVFVSDQDGQIRKLQALPPDTSEKRAKAILKEPTMKLVGGRYIPIEIIGRSSKGYNYNGTDLWKLFTKKVFIKRGDNNRSDDMQGRTIRDRFIWQAEVSRLVSKSLPTPQCLGIYQYPEFTYVIYEYLDGISIAQACSDLRKEQKWKTLAKDNKVGILRIYLQVVNLVKKLHETGYVHRDITDGNFIFVNNKIFVVDFEMSFDLKKSYPWPPFTTGTFGYIAPETFKYLEPTLFEDIYSLGALLQTLTTGKKPHEFIDNNRDITRERLEEVLEDNELTEFILNMISVNPENRPTTSEIIGIIELLIKRIIK